MADTDCSDVRIIQDGLIGYSVRVAERKDSARKNLGKGFSRDRKQPGSAKQQAD
jgi:hypothetical protein